MSKYYQRVELVANILIIVVAIIIGTVLVRQHFLTPSATTNNQPPSRMQPVIGVKMNAPDVDWSQQPKTLILALQKGCHFCSESAPFYKRVIESVKNKKVKLVAVFPASIEESAAHLNELGLTNMEVKQSSLDSLQVSGTPTLILTNNKGEVTDYWVGKLLPDKEIEVINKLNL